MAIKISNALPVQFWPTDDETFNDKDVCGITPICFCQPFECDDQIVTRMVESIAGDVVDYRLQVLDCDGNEITLLDFNQTSSVIAASINPLTEATNFGDGIAWILGLYPSISMGASQTSKILRVPISDGIASIPINFTADLTTDFTGGSGAEISTKYFLFSADMSQMVEITGYSYGIDLHTAPSYELLPSFTPYFIGIQLTTNSGVGTVLFTLLNLLIYSIYFNKTVYENLLIPSVAGICDECVKFKILIRHANEEITTVETSYALDTFASNLGTWFNSLNALTPSAVDPPPLWVWSAENGGSAKVFTTSAGTGGHLLVKPSISLPATASFIRVKWLTDYPPDTVGLRPFLWILDSSGAIIAHENFVAPIDNSEQVTIFSITDSAIWTNADSFVLGVYGNTFPNQEGDPFWLKSFEVYTQTETIVEHPTYEEVFKSDCISIKETHVCTIPITYSNSSDLAGLVFSDSSPIESFMMRIPAIFFEPDNTAEQEDIELSSEEIVRLYNKLEEKRLLDIGFMPHYMHRKLQLALMCDTVTIDELQWIRRDEYKKIEGNKRYPLKRATVLLTDKNFIKENQLS